jgi:hypothetical protein
VRRHPLSFNRTGSSAAIAGGAVALTCAIAGAAGGVDCSTEAAVLREAQSELPRVEVASPKDRPPYCITLETVMAFAGRVQAHLAHCPNSEYAVGAADWTKKRADYSRLFARYRCKRTQ